MSLESIPEGPRQGYMLTLENSPPVLDLTPRSKIRKQVAAIDEEDSDTEHQKARSRKCTKWPKTINRTGSSPRSQSSARTMKSSTRADSCSEEDEEGGVRISRPRGKVASRLALPSETHPEEEGADVYQRIKQQLMLKDLSEVKASCEPKTAARDHPGYCNKQDIIGSCKRKRNFTTDAMASPSHSSLSPDLFASPDKTWNSIASPNAMQSPSSDSDLADGNRFSAKLQALVAEKRKERLARERAAGTYSAGQDGGVEQPKQLDLRKISRIPVLVESESDGDKEVGGKLTHQSRPQRKAGKKALEEMHRETQRMSRNMQLTHEARTKTKFTTQEFLKKFNFRQPAESQAQLPTVQSSSSSTADINSDSEPAALYSTSASSPPPLTENPPKAPLHDMFDDSATVKLQRDLVEQEESGDLPTPEEILAQKRAEVEPPITERLTQHILNTDKVHGKSQPPSVRQFAKSAKRQPQATDSEEDDLEIIQPRKPSRLAVFDRLPTAKAAESYPLHALRKLAHLDAHERPSRGHSSMTSSELTTNLRRRAKAQARADRDEKIQALKAKGVLVQTTEEKEKDQMQLEDMLERARREVEGLGKKEKDAAKKTSGGNDVDDTSDEDQEWLGSEDDGDVEFSGSEEDNSARSEDATSPESETEKDDQIVGDLDLQEAQAPQTPRFDDQIDEDTNEKECAEAESEEDDNATIPAYRPFRENCRRRTAILSDDEDEFDMDVEPQRLQQLVGALTPEAAVSPLGAFGFDTTKPAAINLSEVFAGTMASSPTQRDVETHTGNHRDTLSIQRQLAPLVYPDFDLYSSVDTQSLVVPTSQVEDIAPETWTEAGKTGMGLLDTQPEGVLAETQCTEVADPTQDIGFQSRFSQAVVPASYGTVDTVLLCSQTVAETPMVKKKGRLLRRTELDRTASGSELTDKASQSAPRKGDVVNTAFDIMRKVSEKASVPATYDKERSAAKDMVEEQAEESDDEYAGLGGASDDDIQAEADEATVRMIDDECNETVNEREMAAYHANRERADDEKHIGKLYRDIANGGLRRKRGAEMDLWDSDDEDEAAARRRAQKQRDFAKMRKALLADKNIGKIADNPKQQAFLHAIEDRDDVDEVDFLDESAGEPSQIPDSQVGTNESQPEGLHSISGNIGRGKLFDVRNPKTTDHTARLASLQVRNQKYSMVPSLVDIRNTISEVIGEPTYDEEFRDITLSDQSSGDENQATKHTRASSPRIEQSGRTPPRRRRTSIDAARAAVIDRIALKRQASSSISAHNSSDRLAFHAPAKSSNGEFRVPSLLRKATTSMSNVSESGGERRVSDAGMGKETVRMGGSSKSSVNYYVRDLERKAKLEALEKVRAQGRERVGRLRRSGMGLDVLAGGEFN